MNIESLLSLKFGFSFSGILTKQDLDSFADERKRRRERESLFSYLNRVEIEESVCRCVDWKNSQKIWLREREREREREKMDEKRDDNVVRIASLKMPSISGRR